MLHHRGDVLQVLEVVHVDRAKLHDLIIDLKPLDRERRKEAEHLHSLKTGNKYHQGNRTTLHPLHVVKQVLIPVPYFMGGETLILE